METAENTDNCLVLDRSFRIICKEVSAFAVGLDTIVECKMTKEQEIDAIDEMVYNLSDTSLRLLKKRVDHYLSLKKEIGEKDID